MFELPPPGRLVADDDGARVQCHLCGDFYAKLGTHVSRGHGISTVEYREQFGLNKSTGLLSPALRERLSKVLGPLLVRYHPAESVFKAMTTEERQRYAAGPQRLERRLALSRAGIRVSARRPRKPRPPLSPPGLIGRQRIAELREDPSWRATWRAKRQAVTTRLTREQLEEIAASKGNMTRKAAGRPFGISVTSVGRIWAGEIPLDYVNS